MGKSVFLGAVAIITGAGSGIGRQMSLQAAQRGAQVIGADINTEGLAETEALLAEKGLGIETHKLDVSDAGSIQSFADAVIPSLKGRKLILINNAGVTMLTGDFNQTQAQDFEWLMNINLWGVIRMTKAFYPYLIKQNEGHIVNMSSALGLGGMGLNVPYCTSKFGVRGFTEAIRMELYATGIRTTCVHPGGIKTGINKNSPPRGSFAAKEMYAKTVERFDTLARTSSENAAAQILGAVEKKKERLLIGPDGVLFDLLTRLFPVIYSHIMKKGLDKTLENIERK